MGLISSNILKLLQDQYRHEMSNHFRYVARSSWARFRGLEGIGDFFDGEAKGEAEHADKVRSYIEDRNEAVAPAPYAFDDPADWKAFGELFTSALEVERDTTERLQTIYAEAIKAGDFMKSTWVQGLISEQCEEENLYVTILDRITARGDDLSACHDIDVWIAERLK
jgi:ferritin